MTRTRRRTLQALVLAPLLGVVMLATAQDQPETVEATPEAGQAMVRFLNAAPNAEVAGIMLSTGDDQATVEQFANVGYGEISDYVPVPEGGYDVMIDLASVAGEPADDAVEVPADNLDTFAGDGHQPAIGQRQVAGERLLVELRERLADVSAELGQRLLEEGDRPVDLTCLQVRLRHLKTGQTFPVTLAECHARQAEQRTNDEDGGAHSGDSDCEEAKINGGRHV